MSRGIGKRVLYLWFPRLAADEARRRSDLAPEEPLAIVAEAKNALRLKVLNDAAEALGLTRGMALADARAAVPHLLTRMAEPLREEQRLRALHRWAHRFSPFIAIDRPDALVLDISGCAHLFGGEEAMLDLIRQQAEALGFATRAALADTKGAARALAHHHNQDTVIVPAGESWPLLAELPVTALGRESRQLRRLGLRTLGDVARLPGAELTKRFGAEMTRRLEEALGRAATPVAPTAPGRRYSARLSFPEPIGLERDVRAGIDRLLEILCGHLEEDGRGATALELVVQKADGTFESRSIGMARPSIDRAALLRQWDPVLARLDAGFGIDVLRLVVRAHGPLEVRQSGIEERPRKGSIDDLIGMLGNRLGFDRITCPQPAESHLPGFNEARIPAIQRPQLAAWKPARRPDPLRLFPGQPLEPLAPGRPPGRFRWRGRTLALKHAEGPRRILPEWWHEDPRRRSARDYWRIETDSGERLWLGTDAAPAAERQWLVYGSLP